MIQGCRVAANSASQHIEYYRERIRIVFSGRSLGNTRTGRENMDTEADSSELLVSCTGDQTRIVRILVI